MRVIKYLLVLLTVLSLSGCTTVGGDEYIFMKRTDYDKATVISFGVGMYTVCLRDAPVQTCDEFIAAIDINNQSPQKMSEFSEVVTTFTRANLNDEEPDIEPLRNWIVANLLSTE